MRLFSTENRLLAIETNELSTLAGGGVSLNTKTRKFSSSFPSSRVPAKEGRKHKRHTERSRPFFLKSSPPSISRQLSTIQARPSAVAILHRGPCTHRRSIYSHIQRCLINRESHAYAYNTPVSRHMWTLCVYTWLHIQAASLFVSRFDRSSRGRDFGEGQTAKTNAAPEAPRHRWVGTRTFAPSRY